MQQAPATISGFSLVVERGQTRFPTRPIDTERFLIGAGSNCQLQLGGDVPILHSIILPQADHLWIDAIVAAPPLLVNGQVVRESELRAGDLVEIAGFVFSVARTNVLMMNQTADVEPAAPPQTAAELVDAIVGEIEQLEQLAGRRQQGLSALMEAARMSVPSRAADVIPLPVDPIQAMLQELKQRSEELDTREAALQAHARQLAETQQRLQEQVDQLLASRSGEAAFRKTA